MKLQFAPLGWNRTAWMNLGALTYLVGLIPALFAGGLVVLGMSLWRQFGFLHALGAGCLVGVLLAGVTFIGPNNRTPEGFLYFFAVGFIPTVVCWLPLRLWFRGSDTSPA
jgi:hypothetical protein